MTNINGKFRYDFTMWLYEQLKFSQNSVVTYVPFIPLLGSVLQHQFKHVSEDYQRLADQELFQYSILAQIVIIFVILIYQVRVFSVNDKNGLRKKIKDILESTGEKKITSLSPSIFQFIHIDTASASGRQASFKKEFDMACRNIQYFKIAWIILWINWFCYYIALFVKTDSPALFSFFTITETLCFAACYFLLSYQIFESTEEEGSRQYWWIMIVVTVVFALAIVDQATSVAEIKMFTASLKTLLGCLFLGLLIGTLTKQVYQAPSWLKILLFFYVALQPVLFAAVDVPEITEDKLRKIEAPIKIKQDQIEQLSLFTSLPKNKKLNKKDSVYTVEIPTDTTIVIKGRNNVEAFTVNVSTVSNNLKHSFQILSLFLFNLCLVLKYLLMFYFMWLLINDHLLVHYLRTQNLHAIMEKRRKEFEKEIDKINTKND